MKNNIFKKVYLFILYIRTISKNKENLLASFNARIDYIFRIYTVLNVPKEFIEEPYNLRTNDINSISREYLKIYSNQLQDFLNSVGLRELFDVYEVKKVDKFSYLMIFGFSLFNTKKLARRMVYISATSLIIGIIYFIYHLINS